MLGLQATAAEWGALLMQSKAVKLLTRTAAQLVIDTGVPFRHHAAEDASMQHQSADLRHAGRVGGLPAQAPVWLRS